MTQAEQLSTVATKTTLLTHAIAMIIKRSTKIQVGFLETHKMMIEGSIRLSSRDKHLLNVYTASITQ